MCFKMESIVSVRDRREHKLKIKVIKGFNCMGYKQIEALNYIQGTEISEQI